MQKINADSVDRISRMVFNCDLCLKIWIFFSMKETRGKKPNLLERCKKKLMKALLTGFHAWRSVVIFVYDQTWPLVFWFVFLLGTSTLLKCFNKLFCGGIGVSWAIKLLVIFYISFCSVSDNHGRIFCNINWTTSWCWVFWRINPFFHVTSRNCQFLYTACKLA